MFKFKSKSRQRKSTNADKSGPLYSYYSNRNRTEDDSRKRRDYATSRPINATKLVHGTITVLTLMVIIVSMFYVLYLNSNPKVVQPDSQNNIFLQNTNTYQDAASKLFKQSVFNNNKVTVNVSGITKDLEKQFPELSRVTITLPLISHRPIVYIEASRPSVILNSSSGSYVLNNFGVAIIKSYQAANLSRLRLPTVYDKSDLTITLGKSALSSDDINFITTITQQLTAHHLKVKNLNLPALPNQLDVSLENKPYIIKMNLLSDPKEQVGAYLASAINLEKKNKTPKAYFDVRVEGRVFYR